MNYVEGGLALKGLNPMGISEQEGPLPSRKGNINKVTGVKRARTGY